MSRVRVWLRHSLRTEEPGRHEIPTGNPGWLCGFCSTVLPFYILLSTLSVLPPPAVCLHTRVFPHHTPCGQRHVPRRRSFMSKPLYISRDDIYNSIGGYIGPRTHACMLQLRKSRLSLSALCKYGIGMDECWRGVSRCKMSSYNCNHTFVYLGMQVTTHSMGIPHSAAELPHIASQSCDDNVRHGHP